MFLIRTTLFFTDKAVLFCIEGGAALLFKELHCSVRKLSPKKTIESVSMLIPPPPTPPIVSALGYLFSAMFLD